MIRFEPSHGESSRTSKLTAREAIRIRRLYDLGFRGKRCAPRYGVSAVQFNAIGRREAWSFLPEVKR